jgi:hypothetical protein
MAGGLPFAVIGRFFCVITLPVQGPGKVPVMSLFFCHVFMQLLSPDILLLAT